MRFRHAPTTLSTSFGLSGHSGRIAVGEDVIPPPCAWSLVARLCPSIGEFGGGVAPGCVMCISFWQPA